MPKSGGAARRRRISIDARLVFGVLLVAASVAGVMGIVVAADRRMTVYAASDSFGPGDRIHVDDLLVRSVALDGGDALYLTPGAVPDEGLVITQVVREGELVPTAAVGSVAGRRTTSIVLELTAPVSAAVVPGALVDVWSAPAAATGQIASLGTFGPPVVLSSDAIVVRVLDDDGPVAASQGAAVEVLVPRSRIARFLQAIANGDALAVVPAGLPLGSS
ncbi:hypothetical protein BH11ACT3_BH11ACT3_22260 [soil metagenome]